MNEWIAGVDGCPAGWIVVLRRLDDAGSARALVVREFAEVLALDPAPIVIGVDMPIGLPERGGMGGRRAEVEARANLGKRRSSVFAVPSRAAVMETEYRKACEVARATSDPPRMVAQQCFHIFRKIREIDELISPKLQSRVRETHPEVGFWVLNGEQALELPKKMKSGQELRRDLLVKAGYDRDFFIKAAAEYRRRDVGPDDLLDAAVCSWTAARIARGEGRRFPENPGVDAKGLRMEIWG
jgi:predicted RNase H-like nuclease